MAKRLASRRSVGRGATRARWARLVSGLLCTGGLVTACSLKSDPSGPAAATPPACATPSECSSTGDGGLAPSPDAGVTSPVSDATAGECAVNVDCVKKLGQHHVCRPSDHKCVSLVSSDCPNVWGNTEDDNAVILGVLATPNYNAIVTKTVEFALNDVMQTTGGLPAPGGKTRPLALVECSFPDNGDPLPAARHLAETVRVPAMIGPILSPDVIRVAQTVTIPNKVLMMAPYAAATLISSLADEGLVWRVAATAAAEGPALAAVTSDVEAKVRAAQPSLGAVRVAFLHSATAYGTTLSPAYVSTVSLNGGKSAGQNETDGNFQEFQYPDPTIDPTYNLSTITDRVVAFAPHVVVVAAPPEVPSLTSKIEESWPTTGTPPPRPEYVMGQGGAQASLYSVIAARPALAPRIRGDFPGAPPNAAFTQFRDRYVVAYPQAPVEGALGTYDGVYAILYGMAAVGANPITGPSIALGMKKVVGPGDIVRTMPADLAQGLPRVFGGASIDLEGTTSPLDFDVNGDVTSDFFVWCIAKNPATATFVAARSGQNFLTATKSLSGTYVQCPL